MRALVCRMCNGIEGFLLSRGISPADWAIRVNVLRMVPEFYPVAPAVCDPMSRPECGRRGWQATLSGPGRAAELGRRGGKHANGAGGRALWADVPAAERSRRMRAVIRARWAKKRAR